MQLHLTAEGRQPLLKIPSRNHIAIRCNTLQYLATQCNCTLQPREVSLFWRPSTGIALHHTTICCHTLPQNATHCHTLPHTATHRHTLSHTATHCNTLQHTATHCNTLQHTATHFNTQLHCTLQPREVSLFRRLSIGIALHHTAICCNTMPHATTHCHTLPHIATYCHTLPHTATHCNCTLQPRDVSLFWRSSAEIRPSPFLSRYLPQTFIRYSYLDIWILDIWIWDVEDITPN